MVAAVALEGTEPGGDEGKIRMIHGLEGSILLDAVEVGVSDSFMADGRWTGPRELRKSDMNNHLHFNVAIKLSVKFHFHRDVGPPIITQECPLRRPSTASLIFSSYMIVIAFVLRHLDADCVSSLF